MDTTFEDRMRYLEASRRVRETFARHELANVLMWAFSADEIVGLPEDELESFLYGVREGVSAVEPAWKPAMDDLRLVQVESLRGDLARAFAKIRVIAKNIATSEPTAGYRVALALHVQGRGSDRDGRPQWTLSGRLADGLVWMALKLFSEVPRSLIRTCGLGKCSRVYVASKNQQYCGPHQMEARRLVQRQAERAFRARKRAKKTTPRKKRRR
jgi:hypothetical protein